MRDVFSLTPCPALRNSQLMGDANRLGAGAAREWDESADVVTAVSPPVTDEEAIADLSSRGDRVTDPMFEAERAPADEWDVPTRRIPRDSLATDVAEEGTR